MTTSQQIASIMRSAGIEIFPLVSKKQALTVLTIVLDPSTTKDHQEELVDDLVDKIIPLMQRNHIPGKYLPAMEEAFIEGLKEGLKPHKT